MMNAALWQHVVAIAAALLALGWLVRRAVKGGGGATGPCASCPASRRGGIAEARGAAGRLGPAHAPVHLHAGVRAGSPPKRGPAAD